MMTTLGTCSICGGAVQVPTVYHSIIPPVPTCSSCGATAAPHGPVIPMKPAGRYGDVAGTYADTAKTFAPVAGDETTADRIYISHAERIYG